MVLICKCLCLGASSGIGAATAVLFSKLGATLSLTGRNLDNLKKTAAECEKVKVGDVKAPLLVQADLAKEADTKYANLFGKFVQILIFKFVSGRLFLRRSTSLAVWTFW